MTAILIKASGEENKPDRDQAETADALSASISDSDPESALKGFVADMIESENINTRPDRRGK
jgi:hypothetical protein